jgi:hypothetical protein
MEKIILQTLLSYELELAQLNRITFRNVLNVLSEANEQINRIEGSIEALEILLLSNFSLLRENSEEEEWFRAQYKLCEQKLDFFNKEFQLIDSEMKDLIPKVKEKLYLAYSEAELSLKMLANKNQERSE